MAFYQASGYRSGTYSPAPFNNNNFRQPNYTAKWWKPLDEKQQKLFESYKQDIKTVLIVSQRGISVRKAYEEFAEQIDGEIKYKDLGFRSFGEFLFHCDDVLQVRTDGMNGYYLFLRGRADEDTEHLRKLVEGQSKSTKYKGFKARPGNTMPFSSDILLRVLSRPEPLNGMSNHITRPSGGSSVSGGYRGRGRGYGRPPRGGRGGGSRSTSGSSAFTSGINGVPKLVSYNPEDDQNEQTAAPSHNRSSYYETGEAGNGFPTLKRLSPTLGYMKVRPNLKTYGSSGNKQVSQGMMRAVMSQLDNDDDSDDDLMDQWTWSSARDESSNAKFEDPACWSDGEDIVDSSTTVPKGVLRSEDATEKTKIEQLPTTTPSPPVLPVHSEAVVQSIPLVKPVKRMEETQSSSAQKNVQPEKPVPCTYSSSSKPLPPKLATFASTSTFAFGSNQSPAKPVNPFQPETKIVQEESKSIPVAVSINNPVVNSRPNIILPSAAAETLPNSLVKPKSKLQANTTVVEPWHQMKMPTTLNFSARLLGVDGFGFMCIQVNDSAINKGFEELSRSLQEFYSPDKLEEYRMDPEEMTNGLMVVAFINDSFVRANIYETDLLNNFCILVDLEEHDFHFIDLKDIYHIDKSFRVRRPRAIMCTLVGLEPYMMTQEITDAFEVTPLYPPNVRVTVIRSSCDTFKVPSVRMTIGDGKDVAELLKTQGGQFFKTFDSQFDRQSRKELQDRQIDILKRRNYFPVD